VTGPNAEKVACKSSEVISQSRFAINKLTI
jgi:hypothetical protein